MRIFGRIFLLAIGTVLPMAASGQDERALEYVVRDNGIRCRQAPCASKDAIEVASGQTTPIVDYDASALKLRPAAQEALANDLYDGRLVVLGRFRIQGTSKVLVIDRLVRRAPNAAVPRSTLPRP